MATLTLTDAEKAALTWYDMDDAAIGKLVKRKAMSIINTSDEQGRIWSSAAAMLLCGMAADSNADSAVLTFEGFRSGGEERGDWKVSIKRIRKPQASPKSAR